MDNGGRLIPYEYLGNGSGTLNYNSSGSESSSSSDEDAYEYTQRKEKFYKHLFNSPLKKIRFSVNSKNRKDTSDPTHSCVIDLEEKNIGLFNQVVGFNVISASIPQSHYTITTDTISPGGQVNYLWKGIGEDGNAPGGGGLNAISPGIYTATELASEISGFNPANSTTYDGKTGKFTFTNPVYVDSNNPSLAKILGLDPNGGPAGVLVSPHHIDMRRTSSFDIEIQEIPSICCIHTDHSNNIVARIPVDGSQGSILNYHSQTTDLSTNHFFPIKLSKLSINILDEDGELLNLNGTDYHMICEATVLGDLPEDF